MSGKTFSQQRSQPAGVLGPNLYAVSVLLFAMVGNAQLLGVDVVLGFITAPCVILLFVANPSFTKNGLLLGGLVCIFGITLLSISMRFDMLLGHGLWPIKAVLLAVFATFGSQKLRGSQVHPIAALVLLLILTSTDQDGRQYGIFGPNMLYRFYGLLFLASLFVFTTKESHRLVWLVYMSIGLIGIFQTGSVGALFLAAIGTLLFFRPSLKSMMVFTVAILAIFVMWGWLEQFVVVERLLLKTTSESIENSVRFEGAIGIFLEGLAPFGHSYEALDHVWAAGYDYPHNIFVELFAFYGLLGIPVIFVILIALVIVWTSMRRKECDLFELVFIALLFGSQFSGDLSDNYGVVGLAVAIVSKNWSRDAAIFGQRQSSAWSG